MTPRTLWTLTLLFAVALMATLSPSSAEACGGFFCDSAQPVNQAAERIIFSDNEDGTTTAIIQILYNGPSDRFAWVLPVPSIPTIGLSSNVAFTRLQSATNPNYQLQTTVEGECMEETDFNATGSSSSGGVQDTSSSSDMNGPPVVVVAAGSVGPYDYEVIELDSTLTDPAQVAVDWLETNGYDVTSVGPDLLRPYLEMEMKLLAFRLTKQAESGDVRPVILTYDAELPSIPIKLTAAAADDDMGVLVWTLGSDRAIPLNYLSLELNDAVINWFNPASNYNDVVNLAANEAGGHGFVTEFADASSTQDGVVFQDFEQTGWNNLVEDDWNMRHGELLSRTLGGYFGWDGISETIREQVPLPAEAASYDDLIECVTCYYSFDMAEIPNFDPAAYLAAFSTNVIEPMVETEAVLQSRPYITRLYTTLSAAEMTEDPVFNFNPDLDPVSNQHTAERIIECAPDIERFEAPWRAALPSGQVVRGVGQSWPVSTAQMPLNLRVVQMSTSGEGEVVQDNTETITQGVTENNEAYPPRDPNTSSSGSTSSGSTSSGTTSSGASADAEWTDRPGGDDAACGCNSLRQQDQHNPWGPLGALAALALGWVGVMRRRD